MRGRFITFEGGEGSGKSTQCRLAAATLRGRGMDVLVTREPGATPVGRRLRELLLDPASAGLDAVAELLLYCADRAEHVARVIRPALDAGTLVLCDRFSDATRVYQGLARGLGLELVERANLADITPDLTILLDLPVATGLARAERRNRATGLDAESRFENESLRFHQSVRDGYLTLAGRAQGRIQIVDGERDEAEIATDVLDLIVSGGPRGVAP